MRDGYYTILVILLACFTGFIVGWEASVRQVARECDRLGGFWSTTTVYECRGTSKEVR